MNEARVSRLETMRRWSLEQPKKVFNSGANGTRKMF